MASTEDIERQFQRLSGEAIDEYEADLARLNEQRAYAEARRERREQDGRTRLNLAGVDVDHLEELDGRGEEELDEYLDHVRPSLADREFDGAANRRAMHVREAAAQESGAILTTPYAGLVLAPEAKWLEGIEGKLGNPWILPDNPDLVNLWQSSKGSGLGNCLSGPDFTQDNVLRYDVWFQFVPDETAIWELTALISYSGFWIMRADDGYFSCKYSGLRLETSLYVYQYFLMGPERLVLLDKKDSHVQRHELFDETPFQWTTVSLKAGDPVWVLARIEMVAFAHGSGSYAEINFSDGSANFIRPWLVSAVAISPRVKPVSLARV